MKLGSQVSIGLVGLAALWLWSESKLSAQVRSAPASRQSLSTDAQSGLPKHGENQPLARCASSSKTKSPWLPRRLQHGSTPASDKVQVTGLRFLSWKNFTRVMLELSHDAKYEVRRLKDDPAKGIPPRMYIDIRGARLAMNSKEPVPVATIVWCVRCASANTALRSCAWSWISPACAITMRSCCPTRIVW